MKERSLFDRMATDAAPLAERLRPTRLEELVGQEHLTGPEGVIGRMAANGHYASLIFWGPPGCGKTTLARLLAEKSGYLLSSVSAVASGTAELKKIFEQAALARQAGRRTMLFVDEIHRFNRAQQDVFLPYVENGTIALLGATTENPSFELNAALLSRCRVLVLRRLSDEAMQALLARAEGLLGRTLPLAPEGFAVLCAMADGDGRYFLNLLEELFQATTLEDPPLAPARLAQLLQKRAPIYDKHQESHYNLISALHKSLRGSDVDAALYWLHRMLEGGEAPLYILRRLVRFAVEDIGMSDPQALIQALAAKDAYDFLGSPEGELAIAYAAIYLATAPKSNAAYAAHKQALKDARASGSLMPPAHILNAPTVLMKELGYGKGYAYDHDTEEGFSGQDYFPENYARRRYYAPKERGFEREIKKRLDYWEGLRLKRKL
jgi:putative ATPase